MNETFKNSDIISASSKRLFRPNPALMIAILVFAGLSCSNSASLYTITDLGGEEGIVPSSMNNSDQVVGRYLTYNSQGNPTDHAFLWQNGSMVDLMTGFEAYGINNSGQVVLSGLINGTRGTFLWDHGTIMTINAGIGTFGWAINNSGQVTGTVGTNAFLWQNGSAKSLLPYPGDRLGSGYGINDLGVCVGVSSTPSGSLRAIMWRADGTVVDLGYAGQAHKINNAGQVVGDGYFWDNGTLVRLSGNGIDINNEGEIVGASGGNGALWENGALYNLNDLVVNANGASIVAGYEINDNGHIVATGNLNGTTHLFLLVPIPEPSPCYLLGLGAVVLMIRRYGDSAAR